MLLSNRARTASKSLRKAAKSAGTDRPLIPHNTQRDRTTSMTGARARGAVFLSLLCSFGLQPAPSQGASPPRVSNPAITEFQIPSHGPGGIAAGSDGNLWYIASAGTIGRITPAGGITEFQLPTQPPPFRSDFDKITAGPDGNLWFTEAAANQIGRITPSGVITEFSLPPSSYPLDIVTGPDAHLWYTSGYAFPQHVQKKIGRISPTGAVTEFMLPPELGYPRSITLGSDGALWFTAGRMSFERFNSVGRITTEGTVTHAPLDAEALAIVNGPDGNLWFTSNRGSAVPQSVVRMNSSFEATEFANPREVYNGVTRENEGITTGPDGNVWFTETLGRAIGRITPSGVITDFLLPTDDDLASPEPLDITAGPDGNLWFVESAGHKVGRIRVDAKPSILTEDTTAPRLRLTAPTPQHLRATIGVRVSCLDEICSAKTRGTVRVQAVGSGKTHGYRIRAVTKGIEAARTVRVGLRLSSYARGAIRRALLKRARVTVKLTVTATDAANNVKSIHRVIRLTL